MGNDDEFPEFESGGDDVFAEGGCVVLVGVADLVDEAVGAEPFQEAGYLTAVQFRQIAAACFVLESADVEFAANDGAEQGFVVGVEQVETGIAAAFLFGGWGEFIELVPPGARIFDSREELQIAAVGRFQQFAQGGQTVDRRRGVLPPGSA